VEAPQPCFSQAQTSRDGNQRVILMRPETISRQRFANGLVKLGGFQVLLYAVRPCLRVRTSRRGIPSCRGCMVCSFRSLFDLGNDFWRLIVVGASRAPRLWPTGKALRGCAPPTFTLQLEHPCPALS